MDFEDGIDRIDLATIQVSDLDQPGIESIGASTVLRLGSCNTLEQAACTPGLRPPRAFPGATMLFSATA